MQCNAQSRRDPGFKNDRVTSRTALVFTRLAKKKEKKSFLIQFLQNIMAPMQQQGGMQRKTYFSF